MKQLVAGFAWKGFLFVFLLACGAGINGEAAQPRFINPYAGIDWQSVQQYHGNLHTHTTYSDGEADPHQVIDAYHQLGYHILALTDHDRHHDQVWPFTLYPWTDLNQIYHEIEALESPMDGLPWRERVNEEWQNRCPEVLGMLSVEGNEISRPHHIGSLFNDYPGGHRDVLEALRQIEVRGGLSMMYHPGRYTRRGDPYTVDWYVDLYQEFDSLIGMEVYNRNDLYPEDRDLWDRVLHSLMPYRPVWGFANDDMHYFHHHLGWNRNVFLLESLCELQLRLAMELGSFFFYRPAVQGSTPNIAVTNIEVNQDAIQLAVDGPVAEIQWITFDPEMQESVVFHRGDSVFLEYVPAGAVFVRAVVIERQNAGRLYTQPFAIMPSLSFDLRHPIRGYDDLDPHHSVLHWDPVPHARGYNVIVATDRDFTDVVINEVLVDEEFQSDKLIHGQTYYARVRPVFLMEVKHPLPPEESLTGPALPWNTSGVIQFSTKQPTQVPGQVQQVTLRQGVQSVYLAWDPVGMADSYTIYRQATGEFDWEAVATGIPGRMARFEDQNVEPGDSVSYAVAGSNMLGEGPWSDLATIAVLPMHHLVSQYPRDPGESQWAPDWRRVGRWSLTENGARLTGVVPQAFGGSSLRQTFGWPMVYQLRFRIASVPALDLAAIRLSTHIDGPNRYQLFYWVGRGQLEVARRIGADAKQYAEIDSPLQLGQWHELTWFIGDGIHELYLDGQRLFAGLEDEVLGVGWVELYANNMELDVAYLRLFGPGK